jgi:flagellar hook-associated protein 2
MATVSGVGDLTGYVSQLIGLERSRGPIKVYEEEKSSLTRRNATLTDLRTNLSALNSQVQSLGQVGTLSPFAVKAVTSSATGLVTATASSSALTGAHSLTVTQLAKQSTVVSSQWTKTGSDLRTAAGAGEHTFRLTVAGENTDVTVQVAAGDDNQTLLAAMAAAINGSDAAVTASVVGDTPTTARLVLTAHKTGSENAIALADQSGTLLAATGTASGVRASGTAGGALYASEDLNALFSLDGLSITRGSNSIDDVLTGVTLTLQGTQASGATPLTLSVGADVTGIQAKVQSFLDAFNSTVKYLNERTATTVSANTNTFGTTTVNSVTRGVLSDDPTYLSLLMNLRLDAGGAVTTPSAGGPSLLSELGITAAADGTLSVTDATKFSEALNDGSETVAALFNSENGIATRLATRLAGFVNAGGVVDGSLASTALQLNRANDSIHAQEALLKVRESMLMQQFTQLQKSLSQLTSQQSMLAAVTALSA